MRTEKYIFSIYYGKERENFLKIENPQLYNSLKESGELLNHLISVDKTARQIEDDLITKYAISEGVTEDLKRKNTNEWIRKMNNIIIRVRHIVQDELIYV